MATELRTSAHDASATERAGSIPRRAAHGVMWTLTALAASRVLGFLTNLILARLLSPSDFGLLSFAMVIIGVFTLLQDLGVPAAIIYGRLDVKTVGGTALTINLSVALLLVLTTIVGAPVLTLATGEPTTALVAQVLALSLVMSALSSIQSTQLVKELAYRRKLIPDAVPYLIAGISSIALALAGFGVWSLVAGYLVRTGATTLILWSLSPIRPRFEFDWTTAVHLLRYGRHVSMSSILGAVASNIDYLVIGYALGTHALGIYTMAYIIIDRITDISRVAMAVMFPALSQLRDEKSALQRLFSDVYRISWRLAVPLAGLLFSCAPIFVHTVLGEKWAESIAPLRVLAITCLLRCVSQIYNPTFKALGRPDIDWKFILLRALLSTPLMLWFAQYGVSGVAAVVTASFLLFVPVVGVVLCKTMDLSIQRLAELIWPSLAGGVCMALVLSIPHLLDGLHGIDTSVLGAPTLYLLSLLGYLVVIWRLDPRFVALVWSPVTRRAHGTVRQVST